MTRIVSRVFSQYKNVIAGITIILVALALYGASVFYPVVHAQSTGTFSSGTAWNDEVGWTNLASSGHNDGLVLNSGTISGATWNDYVGWIDFSANDGINTCGSAGQVGNGGKISGWAYILSLSTCINLGDTGHSDGLTFSNGTLSGQVWGGPVIGWIGNVQASITCSPSYYCNGNTSVYMNGQCQPTNTDCTAVPGGTCNPNTGQCQCTPNYTCNGNTSVYTNGQCQQTNTDCTSLGGTCSNGQCVCTPGYTCVNGNSVYTSNQCQKLTTQCKNGCDSNTGLCINNGSQNGCLSTQPWPNCVKTGRADTGSNIPLYWHTTLQNILSCTLVGSDGESYTLPKVAQGSQSVGPVTKDTQYTIVCGDTNGQQFHDSLLVTLIPKVIEK